jgi:hypothetical protein
VPDLLIKGRRSERLKQILVGVLVSNENERFECMNSLRSQTGVEYDVEIIEGLNNKEAHDALYRLFNERRASYSYMLKHDADMIFLSRNSLSQIYNMVRHNKDLEMVMMDVKDWLSDLLIPGQVIYKNTVHWDGNDDDLIVDYHGSVTDKNRSLRLRSHPIPFVIHSPNPTELQAFMYGVHRGAKVVQRGRRVNFARALLHYKILEGVWLAWQRLGDRRRLMAVAGAQAVFEHSNLFVGGDYKSNRVEEFFKMHVCGRSDASLSSELDMQWGNPIYNQERWLLGVR